MINLNLLPCKSPLWAQGGHLQTILGFALSSSQKETLSYEEEFITLPDGDQLLMLINQGESNYIIYLFHGLTGDASASYMERMAKIFTELGHSVCRVNHRDCGGGAGLAIHPYHSGRGEDISEVMQWGRKKYPTKYHIAIGFSLSGNALLTLITGMRGNVFPDYAISVNAPINLSASIEKLQRGINKIYDFHFVNRLKATVNAKYQRNNSTQQLVLPRLSTLGDFDDIYTAPASGFKNAQHYYQTCSTYSHLKNIKTPTILLTSQDDPFVPYEIYKKVQLSSSTQLHIEKTGGHMGYLSRKKTPLGNHRWLDYALLKCVQAFIKHSLEV